MKNNIDNKFIHFQFVDILGGIREKLVPESKFKHFLETGLAFDGSSVNGYTYIDKSDLILLPDRNAIFEISKNKNVVLCEADYVTDSRKILKKAIDYAQSKNYNVMFGTELEFFLFEKDENNNVIMNDLDKKKYLSTFSKKITKFFSIVLPIFEKLKFNIECVHHECGNNQYELDFKFDNALNTADKITIIKQILKDTAEKQNLYVSFMPKPFENLPGNGMHINLSIFCNENNLFNFNDELSECGKQFMAGVMKHIKAITAFANPTINSYKRIHSGYEAPNKIGFSELDRSVLFRIPKAKGTAKRIELRSPDISANPYITFASIIYAGIDGIEKKLPLISKESKSYLKVKNLLPKNLSESLNYLKYDKLFNQKFSDLIPIYLKEKQNEILQYSKVITEWEIKKYL